MSWCIRVTEEGLALLREIVEIVNVPLSKAHVASELLRAIERPKQHYPYSVVDSIAGTQPAGADDDDAHVE